MGKTKPLFKVRKINNLKDMLEQSSNLFKSNKAFILKSKEDGTYSEVTYEQFKSEVDSLGTALIDLGLKNERVAVISPNRYEWAMSYFGVANGTGVIVPIDRSLPDDEIERIINRSEVKAIIYSDKYKALMKEIANKDNNLEFFIEMDTQQDEDSNFLSFRSLIEKGNQLIKDGDRRFIDAEIDNENMSIMLFTSGTSDVSKAVMLSHKNIASNLMDTCSVFKVYDKDIFLSLLPLHHAYEATCGFLAAIYNGAAIAYCEGLKHIAKNLKEFKATVMCSVPIIYEKMYQKVWDKAEKSGAAKKLRTAIKVSNFLRKSFRINMTKKLFKQIHEALGGHIRFFLSGAAAIDPQVAKGFRDIGIKFLQGYGLTECSPLVTANSEKYFKDEAAGRPLPEVEVKIVKEKEDDEVGEIAVKGPNVMLGYYNNEEATKRVLKDGWFYTGDLGYMDDKNFVHITGRKKNVIVLKNGKNVFPEELEILINRSPYIKESMVWGKEDENGDNKICASIVVDKETIEEKFKNKILEYKEIYSLIEQELKRINKNMPIYKYVREFSIRENEFIKTTTRKIKRYMERMEQESNGASVTIS